jgi:hypothetical protein
MDGTVRMTKALKCRFEILSIIKKYNIEGSSICQDLCNNLADFLYGKYTLYIKEINDRKEIGVRDETKKKDILYKEMSNIQNFTNLLRIIGSNRRGSYPTHIAINNNLLDLENSFSNYCYNDEFRNLIYEWIKELNLEFNKLNIS